MVKQQMLLRQIGAINDDELIMPQMAGPLHWAGAIPLMSTSHVLSSFLSSLFINPKRGNLAW